MTQDESPPAKSPAKPGRWLFWARAVFVLCLLTLVSLTAAGVMMIDREITAPQWIKTQVEARAAEVVPGARLEVGAITVRVGRDLHPRVRLYDSTLRDANNALIGRVPLVDGLISPRGLILRQDLLAQEVRMTGAQINLRRAADGSLALAFAGDSLDVTAAPSLPALLDQFDQLFERPALAALELVRADGLIVNYDDARSGRRWTVDGGTAVLDLRGGRTVISGDFALLAGRANPSRVALSYDSDSGTRAAQIGLTLTDFAAEDIAVQLPALSWLRGIDAELTATLRTTLDAAGALGPLSADLDLGKGAFQPNPATAPIGFDKAQASFSFDPDAARLSFSHVTVETTWGGFRAEGDAYLQDINDGMPGVIMAQMRFADLNVTPPGFYETPPVIPPVAIDLRAQLDPFVLDIGQMVASDPQTRALAKGRIAATPAGWDVAIDAQIDQIEMGKFVSYWPLNRKPLSRAWFLQNVTGGMLRNAVVGIRANPEIVTEMALGFEFADTQIQLLGSLPPVINAYGVASIIDHRFAVGLDQGTVLAPQGGPLDLAGSHFEMVDMRLDPSPAHLELRVDSSITAALSILNQPPFSYMDKAGQPVVLADGRARTAGRITWPLMPQPDPDGITFDMTSELTRVRSGVLIPNRTFTSPRLQVTASRAGINIAGPARIGAVDAVGVWDKRFGNPEAPDSRVLADIALDQAFLDEFGINLPGDTLGGSGRGTFALDLQEDTAPTFSLTSDLAGITLNMPALGWHKPAATEAAFAATGTLGQVPSLESLRLTAPGLQADGSVTLRPEGGLAAARFSRITVGDWFDGPVSLIGRGSGAPVGIEITSGRLDMRGAPVSGGQGDSGPMNVSLDQLQLTDTIALTGFNGTFRGQDGFRGEFQGQLNGTATVTGTVAPRNGRTALRLRSDDAGSVLRATGLMRNAVGGALDLTLLPALQPGNFDGTLDLTQFRVRDAPTIAALLDAISVVGLLQQLDGQGLAFDEANATFRLTPDQLILSGASAVGPGLGISADGIYGLESKAIDVQGVVSPFFLVNSIGSFLTRRGEGLVGFSYRVTGNADAPQVTVNPLSVLTPGMLREFFRRPARDISQ